MSSGVNIGALADVDVEAADDAGATLRLYGTAGTVCVRVSANSAELLATASGDVAALTGGERV